VQKETRSPSISFNPLEPASSFYAGFTGGIHAGRNSDSMVVNEPDRGATMVQDSEKEINLHRSR